MFKLEYYVPRDHLEATLQALFAAGAGKIGDYDSCCWYTEGTGQFRPLAGSTPYSGSQGQVEREAEIKVEMVFLDEMRASVVAALHSSHPYETPAYQIFPFDT